jgi:uncharacterized membrane protein YebE (DUF533 family)
MATASDKLKVVKAMAAMAWSDGYMDEREAKAIRALAKRMGLDAHGRSVVEGYLRSRPSISGLHFEGLEEKERDALMLAAVHFAYLDGRVAPAERKILEKFGERLGVDDDKLARMEDQAKQRLTQKGSR